MDQTAEELLRRADRKAQGHTLSFILGGPDYHEAANLYSMAANQYKLQKKYSEAAESFVKVALMQNKMNDLNSEANAYTEAGHLLRSHSATLAAQHYETAAKIYNTNGRFAQSAKLMKTMAEAYELGTEKQLAVDYYRKAAGYFEMDEYSKSQHSQCMVKFAEISATIDPSSLRDCTKIFEAEGDKALRNNLMQFSAKEHFFKAGILLMALGDPIDAKIACEQYEERDPRFSNSREGQLLRKLIEALESTNVEAFVESLREYDNITKLDAWKVRFLNQVRESMVPPAQRIYQETEDINNLDLT